MLKLPCVPCAGLTGTVIRDNYENRGRSWGGGGGMGRYEARRVKGAFWVITCNLIASASHLLVSAVPRIWITVSKSPFLIGLKSICIVILFHHHFIIHPVLFILRSSIWKATWSFHPSCIYNHHSSNRCCIMHKIMYITCKLFILKLRLVVGSMLFTLHPPDLRGGRSVLTRRLIIKFTCVCRWLQLAQLAKGKKSRP